MAHGEKLIEPGPGHNAVPFKRYSELTATLRKLVGKKDEAVAKLRNHRKVMDEAGIDLKAYDLAQKLGNQEQDDAAVLMKHVRQYMAWDSSGDQIDLFKAAASGEVVKPKADEKLAHMLARISEQGCTDALEGVELDTARYAAGSAEQQAYEQGFRIGQDDLKARDAGDAPAKAKKASTRKQKDMDPPAETAAVH